MRGTSQSNPRCVALDADIGRYSRCTIHDRRPSVCALVPASWEFGQASAQCDKARLAHGLADDALTCIALALTPHAKVLIAPAMNGKMWLHPATQENVATLRARGVEFIGPDAGMLSCGYEGVGRLWEVEKIAERALDLLRGKS